MLFQKLKRIFFYSLCFDILHLEISSSGGEAKKVDNSSENINKSKSQIGTFFKNWLNLNRWIVVLYLVVIATSGVLYVGNVNDTTILLTRIRRLEKNIDNLENRRKIIDSKVKRLQSPERIIRIATESLNMKLSDEAPLYIDAYEE